MPNNCQHCDVPAGHCHWCVTEIVSPVTRQWISALRKQSFNLQDILFKDEFSLKALYHSETVHWFRFKARLSNEPRLMIISRTFTESDSPTW